MPMSCRAEHVILPPGRMFAPQFLRFPTPTHTLRSLYLTRSKRASTFWTSSAIPSTYNRDALFTPDTLLTTTHPYPGPSHMSLSILISTLQVSELVPPPSFSRRHNV